MEDNPADLDTPVDSTPAGGNTMVSIALAYAAARCTVQYLLLPALAPVLGFSGALSAGLNAVFSLITLGLIAINLRRVWPTPWRWAYLAFSGLMIFLIGWFMFQDVQVLLGG